MERNLQSGSKKDFATVKQEKRVSCLEKLFSTYRGQERHSSVVYHLSMSGHDTIHLLTCAPGQKFLEDL